MLTRQAVLDLIDPSRLAGLHAQVGEVLRSRIRVARGDQAARLSFRPGRGPRLRSTAAQYLLLAGREFDGAWRSRTRPRATPGRPPTDGPDADREELWHHAADAYVPRRRLRQRADPVPWLTDSRDPQVRLRAAVGYENAAWRPGLPGTQARALLAHALEGVPEDPDDPRYVRALASLGRATAFTGDAERSRHVADLALGQARSLGDRELLRHALETMMWQQASPESVRRRLALATELTPLAKEAQDWSALGTASVFRCALAYIYADRPAWTAATADLDLSVRGTGQPFIAFMRRSGDYAHAFLSGDFAAAARVAEDLLERGRSFGPDDTEGTYGLQMYMVQRETGALEQVRPLLSAISQASGTWEPGLLALYTELGLTQEARDLLWQLLDRIDETVASQARGPSGPRCWCSSWRPRWRSATFPRRGGCGSCSVLTPGSS